jgi:Tol biopolymer transport system component
MIHLFPRSLSAKLGRLPVSVALMAVLTSPALAVVSTLTTTQLTNTNALCVGGGSFYPTLDSTAKHVAFTSFCDLVAGGNTDGNSDLYFMKTDATGLVQLTHSVGGVGIINPYLSSNGKVVVFASDRDLITGNNTDGNYEIFTVNTDGTGLAQLTHTTGGRTQFGFQGNTHPCFDFPAQKIALSSDRDLVPGGNADGNNDLFMMNLDGSDLTQLTFTSGGWGIDQGCLNNGDTRIVLDSDRDLVSGQNTDASYEIFTMNVGGSGIHQLTNTIQTDSVWPRWTADGKKIFFSSDANLTGGNLSGNNEIYSINANGTGILEITYGAGGFGSSVWGITPNGKAIAVESDGDLVPGSNTDRNGEIFLLTFAP